MDRSAPILSLSPGRAIWAVAWPMVLLGWLRTLYLIADAYWVGKIDGAALTSLAAISFAWWILLQLGELSATGVHTRVAQAEGAGRPELARVWAWHGLVLGALTSVAVALTAPWWVPAYVDAVGLTDPVVRRGAADLLAVHAIGQLAYTAQGVIAGVFRGVGQTRTALAITGVGFVANAVLDPVLIWGVGGWSGMGLVGAAWASAIAATADVLLGLVVLWRRGRAPTPAPVRLDRLRQLARIGAPVTLRGVGFSLVYVVLGPMITAHGDLQMAALGVGHRLEGFTYLAAVGYGVGAATLVGQHLGAGDVAGARHAARAAAWGCAGWMVVGAVLGGVGAEWAYGWFTDDPAIVAAGGVYLRSQVGVWVLMGVEAVYEGAFAGAGDTTPPLWIGFGLTLARLPMAYLFDVVWGLGVLGIWLAIAVSTAAKGIGLAWWWSRGGWVAVAVRDGVLEAPA